MDRAEEVAREEDDRDARRMASNVTRIDRRPDADGVVDSQVEKTHWKRLINPLYLGAYSLPPGGDLTVRIDYVARELVKGTDGKEEECTVARMVDEKPMILNRTNSKSIARLYGPYIEDWAGKEITLFATKTKVAKEVVECLRIRPAVTPTQASKPGLSAQRFRAALASVASKERSAQFVRHNFRLTEDQERELSRVERQSA